MRVVTTFRSPPRDRSPAPRGPDTPVFVRAPPAYSHWATEYPCHPGSPAGACGRAEMKLADLCSGVGVNPQSVLIFQVMWTRPGTRMIAAVPSLAGSQAPAILRAAALSGTLRVAGPPCPNLQSNRGWITQGAVPVIARHSMLECYSVLARIPAPRRLSPTVTNQILEELRATGCDCGGQARRFVANH